MNGVPLVPVESGAVARMGYDPVHNELHVVFRSGPVRYIYENVTAAEHQRLMGAPSIGQHGHAHIWAKHRAADHPFRRAYEET